MGEYTDKARKLRKSIVIGAQYLPDEIAAESPELFEKWETGIKYEIGNRRTYNNVLYSCLQSHTSQDDWTPDVAVSLWAKVLNPGPEIPEWEQPSSTNPYMKGDKVRHNGKIWVSDIDNNVWEPGIYGWSGVSE